MSNITPIEVSIDTFEILVIEKSHQQLVILDISAKWCAPCRALEPILNAVAAEYNKDEFSLTKLEAEDENMKIAGRYSVRGFPTVIAFIRGEEVDRFHSAKMHDFVRNFIDDNLGKF
ncbi:MAG: thioredoxin [Gammaproteobacteria bacterium]|uniref:Thioredoxin n=1 Tax=endosymbiont of Bathymodiolus septemdierum str. Myojin knoll TaxID=1303921 RepID=A0A0P0US09_9GAMM|nr:thioredoxin domain-containing protein [Bathymodiolus septemdierum thioautotrophic gill symbiont]RUA06101.1 MAG: thioredoxin [Gammaproteobacteria bacterium]BAS67860.1 thioredoxin [endosymbiont of Bathymodiolus septemdierum str. Myojin knoll]